MTTDQVRLLTSYRKYLQAYVDSLAKAPPVRDPRALPSETCEEALTSALAWRHATTNKDPVSQSELAEMMARLLT